MAPPAALPAALSAIEAAINAAGVPVPWGHSRGAWRPHERTPGFSGIRRLDTTLDVAFESVEEGQLVLTAIAALMPARHKVTVTHMYGGPAVETVAWHGYRGKQMVARVYDKGVESGSAPRGQLIRLEDQRRFRRERRPSIDGVGPASVYEFVRRRFEPLREAPTVTIGSFEALRGRIIELLESGAITPGLAERVISFLYLEQVPGAYRAPARTKRRRRQEVRQLGLMLSGMTGGERVDVELAPIFDVVLGEGGWAELHREAAAAAA